MRMRMVFNAVHEKKLHQVIELMAMGQDWDAASSLLKEKEEIVYVTERVFRLGLIWENSLDFNEEEKKASLFMARSRYDSVINGWAGYAVEKKLIEANSRIMSTKNTVYSHSTGPYIIIADTDMIPPSSLAFAELENIKDSAGWFVRVGEDQKIVYVPLEISEESH